LVLPEEEEVDESEAIELTDRGRATTGGAGGGSGGLFLSRLRFVEDRFTSVFILGT
jgi:hypothetical protein